MLFRRDITQHGAAEPADHRRPDTRGKVVIARRNIRGQWPQRVERRLVAVLQLFSHVAADHLHWHVARPFNHHLNIIFPGDFGQLAQGTQLGELGFVIGILNRTRTQAIAQRQRDVIGGADLTNFAKMLKQETLFMVRQAPFRHD